jgi:hypothetical protein
MVCICVPIYRPNYMPIKIINSVHMECKVFEFNKDSRTKGKRSGIRIHGFRIILNRHEPESLVHKMIMIIMMIMMIMMMMIIIIIIIIDYILPWNATKNHDGFCILNGLVIPFIWDSRLGKVEFTQLCADHNAACHKWVTVMAPHLVCLFWNSASDGFESGWRKSASVHMSLHICHMTSVYNNKRICAVFTGTFISIWTFSIKLNNTGILYI